MILYYNDYDNATGQNDVVASFTIIETVASIHLRTRLETNGFIFLQNSMFGYRKCIPSSSIRISIICFPLPISKHSDARSSEIYIKTVAFFSPSSISSISIMSFRRFFSTGADNLSACLRTRPCIVT